MVVICKIRREEFVVETFVVVSFVLPTDGFVVETKVVVWFTIPTEEVCVPAARPGAEKLVEIPDELSEFDDDPYIPNPRPIIPNDIKITKQRHPFARRLGDMLD
jgi:hypothetical protein